MTAFFSPSRAEDNASRSTMNQSVPPCRTTQAIGRRLAYTRLPDNRHSDATRPRMPLQDRRYPWCGKPAGACRQTRGRPALAPPRCTRCDSGGCRGGCLSYPIRPAGLDSEFAHHILVPARVRLEVPMPPDDRSEGCRRRWRLRGPLAVAPHNRGVSAPAPKRKAGKLAGQN